MDFRDLITHVAHHNIFKTESNCFEHIATRRVRQYHKKRTNRQATRQTQTQITFVYYGNIKHTSYTSYVGYRVKNTVGTR